MAFYLISNDTHHIIPIDIFYKLTGETFGLTYSSPDEIGDCCAFDLYDKPNHADVKKYADYLLETYIDEIAKFPPEMWVNASPLIIHTTNACGSFHSRFNGSFYATHASIYIFILSFKFICVLNFSVHTPLTSEKNYEITFC